MALGMQGLTVNSNSITVKFLLENGKVFTRAYKRTCCIKDLKENLASTFEIPSSVLLVKKEDQTLDDSLPLSVLGVELYGTVELNLGVTNPALYRVSPSHVYEDCGVFDILTVHVEHGSICKQVIVEVENQTTRKPFLGGFRNRQTGVIYHHAVSQTQAFVRCVENSEKFDGFTQTYSYQNSHQNTSMNKGIQACVYSLYFPSHEDKLLLANHPWPWPGTETSEDNFEKTLSDDDESRKPSYGGEKIENGEDELADASQPAKARVKSFPSTKADFLFLFNLVEQWKSKEIKRICQLKSEAGKRAEFCGLLEQEIKILLSIEEYRNKLKKQKQQERNIDFICKFTEPKMRIVSSKYSVTRIEDQWAELLKEIYITLCEKDILTQINALQFLQKSIAPLKSKYIKNIANLLERENTLFNMGIKKEDTFLLHERAKMLFVEFIKTFKWNQTNAYC